MAWEPVVRERAGGLVSLRQQEVFVGILALLCHSLVSIFVAESHLAPSALAAFFAYGHILLVSATSVVSSCVLAAYCTCASVSCSCLG